MVSRELVRQRAEQRGRATREDIMDASGITYRQLDYWCRVGLLEAEDNYGSGSQRTFALSEVRVAELLGRLSRCGLLPGSDLARRAAEAVRRGETGEITEGPLSVFLA